MYEKNCTYCGVASYLRSIGFDVSACSTGGNQRNLVGVVEDCFKGAKIVDGSAIKFGKSVSDASEMLTNKFGDNASGVCSIKFLDSIAKDSGHTFNFTIKDGVVQFFDGQREDSPINNPATIEKFWRIIDKNAGLVLARLDNAEVLVDKLNGIVE